MQDIVDVPIGLVVVYAPRQPDHLVHVQVVAQQDLDGALVQRRVAPRVQQALGGGNAGAFPVHVNRSALQHQGRAIAILAAQREQARRQGIVPRPVTVEAVYRAAPGIEFPVDAP